MQSACCSSCSEFTAVQLTTPPPTPGWLAPFHKTAPLATQSQPCDSLSLHRTRGASIVSTQQKRQNPMPRQQCCSTASADSRELLTNCSAKRLFHEMNPLWVSLFRHYWTSSFILFISCSTSSVTSDVTPSLFENSVFPFLSKVALSPYQSTVVFHAAGWLVNRWC